MLLKKPYKGQIYTTTEALCSVEATATAEEAYTIKYTKFFLRLLRGYLA